VKQPTKQSKPKTNIMSDYISHDHDCKPPFHVLSRDYFACEAHHHFASEAVTFSLLMMTTVLPLVNGAIAVVELIRSSGEAF
jgi:hypothetical protein